MKPEVLDDATISPALQRGQPGVYEIKVTIPAVPLEEGIVRYFDRSLWNRQLRSRGIAGEVVRIKPDSPSTVNERYTNPFSVWNPFGDPTAVADQRYIMKVRLDQPPPGSRAARAGVGAVPLLAGAALVLGALAVGWEAYAAATGKDLPNPVFTSIRKVGGAAGDVVSSTTGGVAAGVAKAGLGLLPVVAIGGGLLWLLTSGGRGVRAGPVRYGKR